MRLVVTGATGNVGTALLRRLGNFPGDYQVTAVSRRPPPASDPFRSVDWTGVDLVGDNVMPKLTEAFVGADAVVHLAWELQPGYPTYRRDVMRRTNVGGTEAVARAAVAAAVPHLVHMSSLGAYAPADGPGERVTEAWPITGIPSSAYSRDKAAAEALLGHYEAALTITQVRPTLILQPDAASEISRYFLGPVFGSLPVRRAIAAPTLRLLPWPRELALQFVHADDVASALQLILDGRHGGAYNVASEPVIGRGGYAGLVGGVGPAIAPKLLRSATAASWRLRLQPTEAGWLDLGLAAPLLDTSRLRDLGWLPVHDGAQTFADFLTAVRAGRGAPGALLAPKESGDPA